MQKMCVASVVPVTRSEIPDSDGFWFCGEWQYSCNPYPTLPSKANTCKSVLMGLLCFCIFLPILVWCCFMIRLCFFVINVAPNKKLQKKSKLCLANNHPLVDMTCPVMVSRDRSFQQTWICDHCDRRENARTPFLRCERCGVDFCRSCVRANT